MIKFVLLKRSDDKKAEKSMARSGVDLMKSTRFNRGTAFTDEERKARQLTGLLPHKISSLEEQVERVLVGLKRSESNIDKYTFLSSLQERNETLFFRVLIDHIQSLMPVVYTPTVGQACEEFAQIFRDPKGFYITLKDKGQIADILDNWPEKNIRLIVATDGERILGLGDLGTNGMGIPIGKLALYCACAGIRPEECLPIMLDVGTDNESLRADPFYLGLEQPRERGEQYFEFIDEFIQAVKQKYPSALLQFEDFATPNAVKLLDTYRDQLLCFNDDIQGTAAVALAGIYASVRATGKPLSDMTFMFSGAGSAATGIGDLLVKALCLEGLTKEQALSKLSFIDSRGLITCHRDQQKPHSAHFAKDLPDMSFVEAITALKPTVLIGATGTPGIFTETVVRLMAELNETPVIFALSNPTSRAECTAEQAYSWSDGRAVFASGSPFDAVHLGDTIRVPGQGNNAYIFPGLGLGALIAQAQRIDDDMLIASAKALANCVADSVIEQGCLYPPLNHIRQVSKKIAMAVAIVAAENGYAKVTSEAELAQAIDEYVYDPFY